MDGPWKRHGVDEASDRLARASWSETLEGRFRNTSTVKPGLDAIRMYKHNLFHIRLQEVHRCPDLANSGQNQPARDLVLGRA